ncbi:MAG: MBOAT family protein [Oscillospiraceae bacterium]|nr:MBOAT family protein [Oscillospiraceae bacterium]
MQFNSAQFLIFFPLVTLGYFVIPDRHKNKWLLAASYYFYMCWNAVYAVLIFFSTLSTWVCANFVSRENASENTRKTALAANIAINLLILFFFKYYGMFADLVIDIFALVGVTVVIPPLSLLLPVGISFYTFQALSYSIDVYRESVEHERNFLNYALFVSFFPQLVAGPIERSDHLLPQFRKYNRFSYENFSIGLRLMLLGFFKKIVIADNLSIAVDRYYQNLEVWPGPLLMLGVVLFAVQVYCDFSAYSDIARGAAKVLGYDLMLNFDHPYFSKSIGEFWRRWHISLGTWFRDYLFYPVLRSKAVSDLSRKLTKAKKRKLARVLPVAIAQVVVWSTTGLWHGAAWTYVAWGLLHGAYQIIENAVSVYRKKEKPSWFDAHPAVRDVWQTLFTFFLVCIGYVFFRSETFGEAWYIITHSIRGWGVVLAPAGFIAGIISMLGTAKVALICLIGTILLFVLEVVEIRTGEYFPQLMDRLSPAKRWCIYYGVLFAIALFGCFEASSFIYFQF